MNPNINNTSLPLRIGITGGIGSGKSYICRQLEAAGFPIFYCDDVAKHIIRTNPEVKAALKALVGSEVYDAEGKLVKSVLAAYLCRGKEFSNQVDHIVHPKVAEAFLAFAQEHAQSKASSPHQLDIPTNKQITLDALKALPTSSTVFMECALLFESGFDRLVHHTVLIHVSHETQISRLMQRDHIDREKALHWIALQLSEDEKMQRADAYLNNE